MGTLIALRPSTGAVTEMSDEALVAALAAGDLVALGALVDRYRPRVHRFVARLSGSEADADDLVQQTFVALGRAASSFRGGSPVRTWMFGIAANLVRNDLRAAKRRRTLSETLEGIPIAAAPTPHELYERNERLRRVACALAALPHAWREAFVLCDLEALSCKEAAGVARVREGTIWRRLHEARKRLRELLGGAW
jgi:RNA polymerase sigma-70 factor (ECF subfamily)